MTTMLMGAVYLTYSAYYVSGSVKGVKTLISMIINLLFIALFAFVVRNSNGVLMVLKIHYQIA
jgi:hypothetical protein